jgi:uncharacterized integral membrane protein
VSAPEQPPGPPTPPPTPATPVDERLPGEQERIPEEDQPSTWQPLLYLRLALLLVVVGYIVAFVVKNTDEIKIDFVFTTTRVHLIWAMLLLLAGGIVGGVLLSQLYRHRGRSKLLKRSRKKADARADLRRRGEAERKSG